MATLETQYQGYQKSLGQFDRVLSFNEWKDQLVKSVEDSMAAHHQTPDPLDNVLDQNRQFVDLIKTQADRIEDIIKFLEYEEAYTVDTRSQQRIANKLKELKVWI